MNVEIDIIRVWLNRLFGLNLEKKAFWQFFKFALTGAFCAVIELGLFTLLVENFTDKYIYTFNALAFSVAVVINYIISRSWIFETGKHSTTVEFIAFILVAVVALGFNQLILYIGITYLFLHYFIAKVLSIFIVMVWNFLAKKFLVFKG